MPTSNVWSLMANNRKLINWAKVHFRLTKAKVEDIDYLLEEALLQAAESYSEERKTEFSTWFVLKLFGCISNARRRDKQRMTYLDYKHYTNPHCESTDTPTIDESPICYRNALEAVDIVTEDMNLRPDVKAAVIAILRGEASGLSSAAKLGVSASYLNRVVSLVRQQAKKILENCESFPKTAGII